MLKPGQIIESEHHGTSDVQLDKKILRNILFNLLSNAIKYSPEDKIIYLRTSVDHGGITIIVKDSGIGIPEEDQKNLFKLFFRASNAEMIQGTGLGLTIVQRYVQLLRGKISFKSTPNKGTEFTIKFPAQK